MLARRSLIALLPLAALPLGSLPLAGCAAARPTPVVVFAPGALAAHTAALTEAYRATGAEVSFEVGHTPDQREELARGATPDVWIAANPTDMTGAAEAGLVDAAAVRQLARTHLAVIVAPGNPGRVHAFADLARPGLRVLLGAPAIPIGAATDATLAKADASIGGGFRAAVEANTATREFGVTTIVRRIVAREADAGIVFVTDAPHQTPDVAMIAVPTEFDTPVSLSIAPVKAGRNAAAGSNFVDFMTVGPGRDVLAAAGYSLPNA